MEGAPKMRYAVSLPIQANRQAWPFPAILKVLNGDNRKWLRNVVSEVWNYTTVPPKIMRFAP
jgi:hypothetical protein